jgi:hypothetical protein
MNWDAFYPPLLGAFCGVFLGFLINNEHKKKLDHERKLFLLAYLRHEVGKGIELLQEMQGNLIPTDAWNSIVNSGDIRRFTHNQTILLGDIYFKIQNYNYEASRTRDASEHFHLLPEPPQLPPQSMPSVIVEIYRPYENYFKAKTHWEDLSKRLGVISEDLEITLINLKDEEWFNEKDNGVSSETAPGYNDAMYRGNERL